MLFVNLNFLVLISPQPIDPVFDGHLQRLFRGIRADLVVQKMDSVIHVINLYPVDKYLGNQ